MATVTKGKGHKATSTKGKATKGKGKAVALATTVPTTKGQTVAQLLAMRAAMPRANLKGHYAIRRALRGNGYFISQNR